MATRDRQRCGHRLSLSPRCAELNRCRGPGGTRPPQAALHGYGSFANEAGADSRRGGGVGIAASNSRKQPRPKCTAPHHPKTASSWPVWGVDRAIGLRRDGWWQDWARMTSCLTRSAAPPRCGGPALLRPGGRKAGWLRDFEYAARRETIDAGWRPRVVNAARL